MSAGLDRTDGVLAVMRHEVVAINVVDIAIVVVVATGRTVHLHGIDPHVLLQVLVVVVNAFVDDADNHVRMAGFDRPGAGGIDIATRGGMVARTIVDIVPLLGKKRVVEEDGRHVVEFDARDELHHVNILQGRNGLAGLGERHIGVEMDVIPKVKAPGAVSGFPLPCRRENAGHRGVRQRREVRAAGFGPGRLTLEFHTDNARDAVLRHLDGRGSLVLGVADHRLLRTRRQGQKKNGKEKTTAVSHNNKINISSTGGPDHPPPSGSGIKRTYPGHYRTKIKKSGDISTTASL